MSFNRAAYQKVYEFARRAFYYHESRDLEMEQQAIEIMNLCEDVIGQQSNFPQEARRATP